MKASQGAPSSLHPAGPLVRLGWTLVLTVVATSCDPGANPPPPAGSADPSPLTPLRATPAPPAQAPKAAAGSPTNASPPPAAAQSDRFLPKSPEVTALVSSFFSASPEQQMALAKDLLRLGSVEALGGVLHLCINLPPGEVKSQICQDLLQFDPGPHRGFLLDSLAHVDPDTRRALSQSLGAHADAGYIFTLVNRFESATDSLTKSSALQLLRAVSSKDAVTGLTTLLADPQRATSAPVINVAAQVVAQQATAPIVNTLTARMDRTTDPKDLGELSEIVAGIRTPSARSALLQAAKGNRDATLPSTRRAAVRALENFPGADTMETFRVLQSDPDPEIRKIASDSAARMQGFLGH